MTTHYYKQWAIAAICLISSYSAIYAQQNNQNYQKAFQQIDSLINQSDQPNKAIRKADSLLQLAKAENNEMMKAKALIYKYNIMALNNNDSIVPAIIGFENEMKNCSGITLPLLESNLAELYYRYNQKYSWKLNQNNQFYNDSSDFCFWDVNHINQKMIILFEKSLSYPDSKTTPASTLSEIIGQDNYNKERPTYYDFLANRALEFYFENYEYQSTEIQSQYFNNPELFYQKLTGKDKYPFAYHAFKCLHKLYLLHKNKNPEAFVYCELSRLKKIYKHCELKNRDQLYSNALKSLAIINKSNLAYADIAYELANFYTGFRFTSYEYKEDIDFNLAVEYLNNALSENKGKQSQGLTACKDLLSAINHQLITVSAPYYNSKKQGINLKIKYNNLEEIKIKAIRLSKSAEDYLNKLHNTFYTRRIQELNYLNSLPFDTCFIIKTNGKDYLQKEMSIRLNGLDFGQYILLPVLDIINKNWSIDYIKVFISDLAYFFLKDGEDENIGYVTDLNSGNPIKGIKINVYDDMQDNKPLKFDFRTDENGSIHYKQPVHTRYRVDIISDTDSLATHSYGNYELNNFFVATNTDRYIYRPGQDIYFKAMVVNYNKNNLLSLIKENRLTVYLNSDTYGQIGQDQRIYASPYYTFSGTIKAPTDKLGEMNLLNRKIRIEEYKRPTFEVKLIEPFNPYKPGDVIVIKGKAFNYAGNPMQNADVSYHLEFSWTSDLTGKTKIDNNGEFDIKFKLPANNQNLYNRIKASVTVTDDLGETQSSEISFNCDFPDIVIKTNIPKQFDLENFNKINLSVARINETKCNTDGIVKIIAVKPKLVSSVGINNNHYAENQLILTKKIVQDFSIQLDKTKFPPGKYKILIDTKDENGFDYHNEQEFFIYDLNNLNFVTDNELLVYSDKDTLQIGDLAKIYIYSPLPDAKTLIVIEAMGSILKREWIDISKGYSETISIDKQFKEGLAVRVIMIRNGAFYSNDLIIPVAKSKNLNINVLKYKQSIKPGEEDEIELRITDQEGKPVKAEVLASMYDASLDKFGKLNWFKKLHIDYRPNNIERFPNYESRSRSYSVNKMGKYPKYHCMPYSEFYMAPYDTTDNSFSNIDQIFESFACFDNSPNPLKELNNMISEQNGNAQFRKDFNETVFFLPNLETDSNGIVKFKYKMRDALTRWRLMIFAQTNDLKFGYEEKEITSQKEMMIMPNVPRFVTEGDELLFSAKVVNYTDSLLAGSIRLQFIDSETQSAINDLLTDNDTIKLIELPARQSKTFQWKIKVPVGKYHGINYKISATANQYSDGEEATIPVLSKQILLTESMPFRIKKKSEKNIKFESFKQSDFTKQIPHRLTFELNQNPVWDVIQALPYLIEYPYECNEQLMNRLYAYTVAKDLFKKYPEISSTLKKYRNSNAPVSQLNKNQELKNILIEEMPWAMVAENEESNIKKLAILLEPDIMEEEIVKLKDKIQQRQNKDGTFSWFPGGEPNQYISQYMVEKIAEIEEIDAETSGYDLRNIALKVIQNFDNDLFTNYKRLAANEEIVNNYKPSYNEIHYLYVRSGWLKQKPVTESHKEALEYMLKQASANWKENSNYGRAMLAIALHRFNHHDQAALIMASLKDNAIVSENDEMFWNKSKGWQWYRHDIETHTMIMKAFNEVLNDALSVDKMKTWLLRNKKLNHWNSTISTSSAIYSLLNLGNNWLRDQKPVIATVGTIDLLETGQKENEANLKKSWTGNEITKDKGDIRINNPNDFPVWGGMYWQYFQNQDSVSASGCTEMKITRNLFLVKDNNGEKTFEKITPESTLKPGDLVAIKIGLKISEDMEFVHIKDSRSACLEPENQLSGYKSANGISYYETPRDASAHFFFDRIAKGEYTIEYNCRVSQTGDFSNGICTIENLYAPEFKAQSGGMRIKSAQ